MLKVLDGFMDAAKTYTLFDYACLKIALITFGILLGVYFTEIFLRYTLAIWTVFIVSYAWIGYRTLVAYRKR
ncbi:MAG TPA: hypothetical protein VN611_10750 [Patescibacteria group bacterium]|nr:hypothetical protein [Patescibacteria group bacterium]